MGNIEVRQTLDADKTKVSELYQESLSEISGKRGESSILSATVSSQGRQTAVVCVDGVVLGFCYYRTTDAAELIADWFYIAKPARKVGLGAALLDYLLEVARQANCTRIASYALPGDAKTKNFFESFGIKASLLTVGKDL